MAEGMKQDDSESELIKQLNRDFDEHLKDITEKNKDYSYDGILTSQNFEEEVRKIPAFINKTPTQEDIDASPALSALQAIKYEESDPDECALAHKEDGNHHFKAKAYKKAVLAYTEGLKQKTTDKDLKVALYTNRAAAQFHLENHRSSLMDAKEALKLNSGHLKALIRGAMCCFELKLFEDCMQYCDNGLLIDKADKKLLSLRNQASEKKKKQDRDKRKQEKQERQRIDKQRKLNNALKDRKIKVKKMNNELDNELNLVECLSSASTDQPQHGKLYLDGSNELHWPVYFLYPEFNQLDFIEDFSENSRLADHLSVMFDPESLPDWDVNKIYLTNNLKVYFDDVEREKLIEVSPSCSLKEVLQDERCIVQDGVPSFWVLSTKSKYFKVFCKDEQVERF